MLVVLVRRVERERVPGVVLAGWPGIRAPPVVGLVVGLVVPAGLLYIVPGVVPTGVVTLPGVVMLPGTVLPGVVPTLAPVCPGTVPVVGTPGAPGVPRVPGTVVWAKAELPKPSPSRTAKNTWEVFIMRMG